MENEGTYQPHARYETKHEHVKLHSELARLILQTGGLVHYLTLSNTEWFNKFLTDHFPQVIEKLINIVWVENGSTHKRYFENLRFGRPFEIKEASHEAFLSSLENLRLRSGTLGVTVYIDVVHVVQQDNASFIEVDRKCDFVLMPVLPIPFRCHLCPSWLGYGNPLNSEPGSVFYIKGVHRYMPNALNLAWNIDLVFPGKKNASLQMDMRCIHPERLANSTSTIQPILTKRPSSFSQSNPHNAGKKKTRGSSLEGRQILYTIPHTEKPVSVVVLFLALGLRLDAILPLVMDNCPSTCEQVRTAFEQFVQHLLDTSEITTELEALLLLSRLKKKQTSFLRRPAVTDSNANKKRKAADALLLQESAEKKQRMGLVVGSKGSLPESKGQMPESKGSLPESKGQMPESKGSMPPPASDVLLEQRIKHIRKTLDSELCPHITLMHEGHNVNLEKCHQLAWHLWRFFLVDCGSVPMDKRDDSINKRRQAAGLLFAGILRQMCQINLGRMQNSAHKHQMDNKPVPDFTKQFNSQQISSQLLSCMKRGIWTASKYYPNPRTNMVQNLNSMNDIGTYSALSKEQTMLANLPKHLEARELQPGDFGRMCPVETPESKQCGMVRFRTPMRYLSVGSPVAPLSAILLLCLRRMHFLEVANYKTGCFLQDKKDDNKQQQAQIRICLNGRLLGWLLSRSDVPKLVDFIRRMRRSSSIDRHTEIGIRPNTQDNLIDIWCDPGRQMRLLIVRQSYEQLMRLVKSSVEKQAVTTITLDELLQHGYLEWVGPQEEMTMCSVTSSWKSCMHLEGGGRVVTHLEIHESLHLGINAGLNPYIEKNQSPRNTYQANMQKHAVSAHFSGIVQQQGTQHTLCYPQRPLVSTLYSTSIGEEFQTTGVNAIVAVMPYSGWNIEDAVVEKRGFVERGGGMSIYKKTYVDRETKHEGMSSKETYEIPNRKTCAGMQQADYSFLDPVTKMVRVGATLPRGTVLIGKTTPIKVPGGNRAQQQGHTVFSKRCASIVHKGEPGVVKESSIKWDPRGLEIRIVVVESMRVPIIGDKFASRHGQKGVMSCLENDESMPFNPVTGMCPDIIINSLGFPSRMTLAQPLEGVHSKARVVFTGKKLTMEEDGTPFEDADIVKERLQQCCAILKEAGFCDDGTEVLCDGRTGQRIEARIFMTPIYTQRLKHMVIDKMHVRSTGPVDAKTRQPTDGRSRDGGLRLGEMERDSEIAHAATSIMYENQSLLSDRFDINVCKKCGNSDSAHVDWKQSKMWCKFCNSDADVRIVRHVFTGKTMADQVMATGGHMSYLLEDTEEELTASSRIVAK
jgi:DNA-directed RNA polymerase beta subunit